MRRGWVARARVAGLVALAMAMMACDLGSTPLVFPRLSTELCGPKAPPIEHGSGLVVPVINLRNAKVNDMRVGRIVGPPGEVEVTANIEAREITIRSLHRDGPERRDRFEVEVDIDFTSDSRGAELTTQPMSCMFSVVHTATANGPYEGGIEVR